MTFLCLSRCCVYVFFCVSVTLFFLNVFFFWSLLFRFSTLITPEVFCGNSFFLPLLPLGLTVLLAHFSFFFFTVSTLPVHGSLPFFLAWWVFFFFFLLSVFYFSFFCSLSLYLFFFSFAVSFFCTFTIKSWKSHFLMFFEDGKKIFFLCVNFENKKIRDFSVLNMKNQNEFSVVI